MITGWGLHESNPERIDDIFSYLPAAHSGQSPVYSLQGKLAPTVQQALKISQFGCQKKNISNFLDFERIAFSVLYRFFC